MMLLKKNLLNLIGLSLLFCNTVLAGHDISSPIRHTIGAAPELPRLKLTPEIVTEINTNAIHERHSLDNWSKGNGNDIQLSDDLIEVNPDFFEYGQNLQTKSF